MRHLNFSITNIGSKEILFYFILFILLAVSLFSS